MAVDPVPYFVGQDGVRHSAEVVRAALYASTGGAEGVSGASDLKVTAQAVPNGTVQVLIGGALLRNRYAGGTGQSYALRNATATNVPVVATGSGGGRIDMVVARILDTQYEGTPPADPNNFQYSRVEIIQGVGAGVSTAAQLNLGYPAVELARVTLPPSTATVTAGMITDLRRLPNPRKDRSLLAVYPTAARAMQPVAYGSWPLATAQRPSVLVPEWATKLQVLVHMGGVGYTKSTTSPATVGKVRTVFAGVAGESITMVQDGTDSGNRNSYLVVGSHAVPAGVRGTVQEIGIEAYITAGTGGWTADGQSTVAIDYEFSEGAA